MNLEQPCIRISVRNLVDFILRHGDIDNRTGGADKDDIQYLFQDSKRYTGKSRDSRGQSTVQSSR